VVRNPGSYEHRPVKQKSQFMRKPFSSWLMSLRLGS
jgi:hypothetical protein